MSFVLSGDGHCVRRLVRMRDTIDTVVGAHIRSNLVRSEITTFFLKQSLPFELQGSCVRWLTFRDFEVFFQCLSSGKWMDFHLRCLFLISGCYIHGWGQRRDKQLNNRKVSRTLAYYGLQSPPYKNIVQDFGELERMFLPDFLKWHIHLWLIFEIIYITWYFWDFCKLWLICDSPCSEVTPATAPRLAPSCDSPYSEVTPATTLPPLLMRPGIQLQDKK
ncbi:hypothetical protein ACS0TY_002193 [Phlomoides rotata]